MYIADARVIVSSPGRNFVTLVVETNDGMTGLGDATLNGRELAVASYLNDHVLPVLEGRDPFAIEELWHWLYKGAYWRRGPVTMTAIGAVDVALWDLKGKALAVPVYELLGGRSRDAVKVYGHANGGNIEQAIEATQDYVDAGYRAVRVQSGLPTLPSPYGVGSGTWGYEPAEKGRIPEEGWDTSAYVSELPQLFRRVREELGWSVELLHDAHHRLTPIEAARLARDLEPYRLLWLEDPFPAEVQESFRTLRRSTTTPLAVGEVFNSIYDCHLLLNEQLIDYVRVTPAHAGGLTHLQRIAHLAELNHVRTGCHGPTDLSPINLAASLHFDISVHNFGIQEYMRHPDETTSVFSVPYQFENGYLHLDDQPGLGVVFDEQAAGAYPYESAYLPIARTQDGAIHSW